MSIRRNGTQKRRELSRRFPLPEGTEAFEYIDDLPYGSEDDDTSEGDDDDDEEQVSPATKKKKKKPKKKAKKKAKKKKKGKGNSDKTKTPKTLQVVQQSLRTLKNGQQVVDLTIDVQKIGGADKYEFRIVKKDNGSIKLVNVQ